MGRNATININNNTGYKLTYVSDEIEHGKFQKGKKPPPIIDNNTIGTFEVGNITGSKIGPKGTVTYSAEIIKKDLLVKMELVFFWNHPFGGQTSVYSVGSIPTGFCNYSLSPAIPVGHDQEVTITVQFENLIDAYDIENWMRYIDEEKSLLNLTIPGTHDSGAINGGAAFECQTLSIKAQLEKGIRFLDIRCKLVDGELKIYHGDQFMNKTFKEVMQDCIDFLKNHIEECIIMSVKQEGGDNIAKTFEQEIEDEKTYWWLHDSIPLLKLVRHKIVLLRRFSLESKYDLGINATNWSDNDPSFWTNDGNIHVQDEYEVYDTVISIDEKWKNIKDTMNNANTTNPDKMYINFTSGSGGITPKMLATGEDIVVDATGINQRLYQKISQSGVGRFGILVMDFPENPTKFLIPYIIAINQFKKVI